METMYNFIGLTIFGAFLWLFCDPQSLAYSIELVATAFRVQP